ncbi:excinuclease ABC subunit UvrC [Aminicella lysinilytica]|uniref:UvrABC system protein C n=1 Tax=Aminicella lysinilytica TaxID=433323 RepID=A0A4R6QBR7_9FIRM|nr:excinuclease ABC subunit UvrC [Aminicella lysinilytica]TDP59587.1 excinuclease ABC subunit C [Aminicella lysinilytica]
MFDIKENLKKLPDSPGVYMHKDKLGQVIYVGKAISLRNRVRQYFQSPKRQAPKVRAMVSHIAEFEYITCNSEMEALILECNLIKKYMPKYNVLLRDDKTYPYIMVTTSEEYPRIVKTRIIKKDGNRYFGPYSDAGAVNRIVELFSSIYKLKRCAAQVFPEGFRPCLNYFIKECRGICAGGVDREEYAKDIEEMIQFLSGKDKPLIKSLETKMNEASDKLDYENAAKYRDYIADIRSLAETQRVTMINDKDLDIILPVKDADNSFIVLFPVRGGKLSGRETFQIQSGEGDTRKEMVSEFIKQYYSQWAVVPPEILVEEEPQDRELLEEFLGREGHKVSIFVPQKGDKRALLNLTRHDVVEMTKTLTDKAESRREKEKAVLDEMNRLLEEAGYPRDHGDRNRHVRVESYDISNTNGVDSVGAMVVFSGLEKVSKDYRRFKVRTIEGPDDYGSLQEVLYRRYKRALSGDKSFIKMPDIIMMDGGQGQVSAARKVLTALKLDIPVTGMTKDDSHRTRAIVFEDGTEIDLKERPVLFRYAGTIQEEVHRFAIDYHHKLHGKNAIHSVLDNIDGVGPKRRNELLYYFKTIDAIKRADVEELCKVPSITETVAKKIVEYFA